MNNIVFICVICKNKCQLLNQMATIYKSKTKYIKNRKSEYLINESKMRRLMEKSRARIWINSFGGAYSNFLYNVLMKSNLRVNSLGYHMKGCHYIKPIIVGGLQCAIFAYVGDIRIALSSQLNRKIYHNFYKLTPGNIRPTIRNWLYMIYLQIAMWTCKNHGMNYDIIIMNMEKYNSIRGKLFEYFAESMMGKKRGNNDNGVELFKYKTGNVGYHKLYINMIQKFSLNGRSTKKYHSRFLNKNMSESERELVETIDKKLKALPDFVVNYSVRSKSVVAVSESESESGSRSGSNEESNTDVTTISQ